MLKNFVYIFILVCSCLYGAIAPSHSTKTSDVQQMAIRNFEGRVEKLGFFAALTSHYAYGLYQKDRCIAFLDCKEKVRMPKLLETFVGKNVIVKGMPQCVNKEPYLLIFVDDVCGL